MANTSPRRVLLSILWALSPLLTLGFASPLTFTYAAIRLRSWVHWLAAALYLTAEVVVFAAAETAEGSAGDVVFSVAAALSILGGTAHAFVIRGRVFAQPDGSAAFEHARRDVRRRRELRARAADIARRDPGMALEMRIGRPDLPRAFDDGGLVDVNHAPAGALVAILGLTPEQADLLVEVRARCDGFVSAEEAAALTGLPPALTPRLAEYGVFLR